MTTLYFPCDCQFQYDEVPHSPVRSLHLCEKHAVDPQVQNCKVRYLKSLISTLQEVSNETVG